MPNGTLHRITPRMTLAVVTVALLAMVASSLVYRIQNPSLTRERAQAGPSSQQEMMGMVGQLMQRLEENPKDVSTLTTLARAFMRMQAWDQAQRFWKRLLEVEPGNVQARQQLAMSLFRQDKYQAAARELKRVLSSRPDNAYASFNLGILYMHYLEDKAAGRRYLQDVIDSPHAEPDLKRKARQELKTSHGG